MKTESNENEAVLVWSTGSSNSRSNNARFMYKLSKQTEVMLKKLCKCNTKFFLTKDQVIAPCDVISLSTTRII